MAFKHLTGRNNQPVWINEDQILFIEAVPDALLGANITNIVFVGGMTQVLETPQQILGYVEETAVAPAV